MYIIKFFFFFEKKNLEVTLKISIIILLFSLNDFFTRIDFGEKANKFLQSCGVKNEPSPIEFAELLVTSSRKLWNLMGDNVEKYLTILRRISIDYDIIASRHSDLIDEMMKKPI